MVRNPRQTPDRNTSPGCLFNLFPLIILGVLFFGALTVAVVSTRSLPGDRLYPIKRYIEQIRLDLTRVPSQRLELEMAIDQTRLDEIEALTEKTHSTSVDFAGGLMETTQGGEWTIGDIQVRIQPDTEVIGKIKLGTFVTVVGTLLSDKSVVAERIQLREYTFTDKLHSVASNQWLVDGVTVHIAPDTIIIGNPKIGSEVTIKAYRSLNDQFIARVIEEIAVEK